MYIYILNMIMHAYDIIYIYIYLDALYTHTFVYICILYTYHTHTHKPPETEDAMRAPEKDSGNQLTDARFGKMARCFLLP